MRLHLLRLLTLSVGLSAVPALAQQVPCLPVAEAGQPAADIARAAKVKVYQDASLSMLGFVEAPGNLPPSVEGHFVTLARDFPGLIGGSLPVEKKVFGNAIRDYPKTSPLSHEFYKGNEQSRIDLVLDEAYYGGRDVLTVIITDLAIRTPKDVPGGLSVVANQLARLIEDGRSVALIGLRTPFKGTIEGAAKQKVGGKTVSPVFEGFAPVYLVAVGPLEDVVGFVEAVRRKVLAGVRHEDIHVALYTDPHIKLAGATKLLFDTSAKRPEQPFLAPKLTPHQLQILDRSAPLKIRLELGRVVTLPDAAAQISEVAGEHGFYLHPPARECAWTALKEGVPVVSSAMRTDKVVVVDVAAKSGATPAQLLLAVHSRIRPSDITGAPEVAAWINQWDPPPDDATAKPDQMLPTLGLKRLHEAMLTAIRKRFGKQPIAEATLVFKID